MRVRHGRSLLIPLLVATIGLTGCTCNDSPEPVAPPVAAAPPPPEATPAEAAKESKADRIAARGQQRGERREQRKLSFDAQLPVFEFAVRAASPAAEKVRAEILAAVQPVAGVPLRWTLRSCASETMWDSADRTLQGQGVVLATEVSLDPASCTQGASAGKRTRSALVVSHHSADAAAVRSSHEALVRLAAGNGQTKVSVESASSAPEATALVVVRGLERHRGALSAVDTSSGMGKVLLDRFWPAGSTPELTAVCDRSLTTRSWILEEEEAMPSNDAAPAATGKGGKARKPRERHRSWARLTVRSSADATLASLHMRASRKRDADPARVDLPITTYSGLQAAGLVEAVPLIDARYRCGG